MASKENRRKAKLPPQGSRATNIDAENGSLTPYLIADPRRQANDSIRGYDYQIWVSVSAWIDLPDSGVIYIEGAEDLDLVSGENAVAIQVKDTKASGRITLNSPNAITALENFLECRLRNPTKQVTYRYHTTSTIAKEKASKLEKAGIEIWNEIQSTQYSAKINSKIEQIVKLLSKKAEKSGLLANLLQNSKPNEIYEVLIQGFSWATGEPGTDQVIKDIEVKLSRYGSSQGISYQDSIKAANALYTHVMQTAAMGSKLPLTRHDFLAVFSKSTSVSIPISAYTTLVSQAVGNQQNLQVGVGPIQTKPPKFHGRWFDRHELRNKANEILLNNGILWLYGGTGTGKSNLANSLAQSFNMPIIWLDLRDAEISVSLNYINYALGQVSSNDPKVIVLDDLSSTLSDRNMRDAVGRLADATMSSGSKLLVTSYSPPPVLYATLGFAANVSLLVGAFSDSETASFLIQEGCPTEPAEFIATVIWLQTSGHPQLVNLVVSEYASRGFPTPTHADFVETPPPIADARVDALRLIEAGLHQNVRDFLYSLSIVGGQFKKELALCIGTRELGLSKPGEAFLAIEGAWLERRENGYYRTSPLINGLGLDVYDSSRLLQIRKRIAHCALSLPRISQHEVVIALNNSYKSKDEETLVRLSISHLSSDQELQERISPYISWFSEADLSEFQISARPIIRAFQYRIARLQGNTIRCATLIRDNRIEENGSKRTSKVHLASLALFFITCANDFPKEIEIDYLVRQLATTFHVIASDSVISSAFLSEEEIGGRGGGILWHIVSTRISSLSDLTDLLSAIEQLNEEDRNQLLNTLEVDSVELQLIIDGPWARLADTDRGQSLPIYLQTLELAKKWRSKSLVHAASRMICIIYDEYLQRSEDALLLIDSIVLEWGESILLTEQKSSVLYGLKRYSESLENIEKILEVWDSPNPVDISPFTARRGAMAASELGEKEKSIQLFVEGSRRASARQMQHMSAGLLADAALAAWKSDEYDTAVRLFARVADALENLGMSASTHSLLKLVGHVVGWVCQSLGNGFENLTEPILGICSNPNPHQGLQKLPPTPYDYILLHVSEIAYKCGDYSVLDKHKDKIFCSQLPEVEVLGRRLWITAELERENYLSALAEIPALGIAQEKSGYKANFDLYSTTVSHFLTEFIFRTAHNQTLLVDTLEKWKNNSHSSYKSYETILKIDQSLKKLTNSTSELVTSAISENDIYERAQCAAIASYRDDIDFTGAAACKITLFLLSLHLKDHLIESILSKHFDNLWNNVTLKIEDQQQLAKLLAMSDWIFNSHGIQRAARYLLVELPLTKIKLDEETSSTILKVAFSKS